MRLAFDLSVLRQPAVGTVRYATELRRAMGAAAGDDTLLDALGWPRGPRASRWRPANLASEIGWLTVGADVFAVRNRIDAWYGPANSLPMALPRPKAVTIHDTTFLMPGAHDPAYARWARVVYGAAGRRADVVFVPSEATRASLASDLGIDPGRITVAYPGVDHLAAHASSVDAPVDVGDPAARYALTVSQTEPHKNIAALVTAWQTAVPADLELWIAGPAGRAEADLAAAIAASPRRERIRRLGAVDDARLTALYQGATCFLFPSLAEGFGIPPLEAMAFGIPTGVAAAGSLPEVTAGAAVTFDPHDPADIAAAVTRLADDPDLRRDLASRGPLVADRYRWASTAETIWGTIRKIRDD